MKVPSTEVQNNFGKYLKIASEEEEVIITRKGRPIARMLSCPAEWYCCEEAEEYAANSNKTSYEDFLKLTENSDARYELIDGEVYCLASPSYNHQIITGVIYNTFFNWLKGKHCRPLTSPLNITLKKSEDNICVVQPDIIVICDTDAINEKGRYMGVPSLAVEVLSDSTRKRDMIKKLDLFMQTDVKEYWLVDTANKKVFIYIFEDRTIKDCKLYTAADTARSEAFEGLEVALPEVFG